MNQSDFNHNLSLLARLKLGQGYDLHRLVPDRPLRLGGVTIDSSPLGSLGHSDGDVVLHALMDALIAASGMDGDIGTYFPPTSLQWAGANSVDLLRALLPKMAGMRWLQVDITVFLEAPKLGQYKAQMAEHITQWLTNENGSPTVSVKAKTAEGLGDIGLLNALASSVLVLGVRVTI